MRRLLSLTADTMALFTGLGLSILPVPAVPFAGTAAALLSLIEGVDRLRRELESRIGPERTELALELGQAAFSALAQRPYTLFVDVLHKGTQLREARARTGAWDRLEPTLAAAPNGKVGDSVDIEPRPAELPRGPIEEYADRTWIVSLGGFAVSFVTSRSVQRAIAALYGSLPRPAQLGREVFCSEVSRILSARDALVMQPEVLRRLDRMDCLVLPGDLSSAKAFSIGTVHVLPPATRRERAAP